MRSFLHLRVKDEGKKEKGDRCDSLDRIQVAGVSKKSAGFTEIPTAPEPANKSPVSQCRVCDTSTDMIHYLNTLTPM
jgi:hypothetical protein